MDKIQWLAKINIKTKFKLNSINCQIDDEGTKEIHTESMNIPLVLPNTSLEVKIIV